MNSIHSQIHGIFTELIQLQSVDLHHQIEGGALGLFCEADSHLSIDIRHDHLAVLVGQSDPQLVVALFDPVKSHPRHHGAVADGEGGLGGGYRVEGAQDANLAAVIDRGVAKSKDFKFQRGEYAGSREASKASAYGNWEAEPCSWIGRAGCISFRKSFGARSLRAFHRAAPRSRPVVRKDPPRHPFPPNGIVPLSWERGI